MNLISPALGYSSVKKPDTYLFLFGGFCVWGMRWGWGRNKLLTGRHFSVTLALMSEVQIPPELTQVQHAVAAAEHMAYLSPGRQPLPFFLEGARIFPMVTAEVVALQGPPKDPYVFLDKRPPDDQIWGGEWAIPGAVLTAADPVEDSRDLRAPLSRTDSELAGLTVVEGPFILEPGYQIRTSKRGREISLPRWAVMIGKPAVGQFFRVADLEHSPPDGGVVTEHPELIDRSVHAYRQLHR